MKPIEPITMWRTDPLKPQERARWLETQINEIDNLMASDGYVFCARLDDELRELCYQLAELKLNHEITKPRPSN